MQQFTNFSRYGVTCHLNTRVQSYRRSFLMKVIQILLLLHDIQLYSIRLQNSRNQNLKQYCSSLLQQKLMLFILFYKIQDPIYGCINYFLFTRRNSRIITSCTNYCSRYTIKTDVVFKNCINRRFLVIYPINCSLQYEYILQCFLQIHAISNFILNCQSGETIIKRSDEVVEHKMSLSNLNCRNSRIFL